MHKSITIIFAILALFILSLCSACVSQSSPNQTSGQNVGLTQINVPSESTRISFETAQQKLKEYRAVSFNESSINKEKLYYILAKDVDDQGKATSWIFGVNQGAGSRLLIFDTTGWTNINLNNSELPSEEIVIDHIVPPSNVFSENKAAIIGNAPLPTPELREIELKGDIYTLTITSGGTVRTLKFNSISGAMIV
jgi:hypothetical protein